jgi:hypothetical protein
MSHKGALALSILVESSSADAGFNLNSPDKIIDLKDNKRS